MGYLLRYTSIFFLFFTLSFAQDLSYLEKRNNNWLQVYSNLLKAQILDDEIKSLEISIKNASGRKKVELNQLLELQKSKKKILDELPQTFDTMLEKISMGNEVKEINLVEYLLTSRKSMFDIQMRKLFLLQQEYDEAVKHLKKQLKLVSGQESKDEIKEYQLKLALDFFDNAKGLLEHKEDVLKRTKELYFHELKRYEQTQLPVNLFKLAIIVVIFIVFYILKYIISKRIEDEDRFFKTKKILNVTFFLVVFFIIVIFNINDIIYAATLISLIAAAITISMKEYLQSIVAWIHLAFGNNIKVGDRILINFNTNPVIGEVINISLFKVTLYESINNTTSLQLKRAGRIVFIPNNFFVTNYVYNYTHDRMKTIYDLIELRIPFTSDTQKVESIATEIAYESTERYIEVTAKQFLSLKDRYDMRTRDFRPRIHLIPDDKEPCFILYVWYIAPYHQIMEFKSNLSKKIVKRLQEEGVEFCGQSKKMDLPS